MAFHPTGSPENYTIGGLQFMFWETLTGSITSAAITAADAATHTITASGFGSVVAGAKVEIKGSAANNGIYTVVSATATEVVVVEDLVDSAASGTLYAGYAAYLHFGNIVTGSFTSDVTFLDHFSAKTGTRKKDRSVPQEISVTVNLTVDEPSPELLNLFVLGGAIVGAGPKVITPYTRVERKGVSKLFAVSDTGNEFIWDIPYCTVKPDGEFAYNDQDWSQYSFIVEVLSYDNKPTEPYGRITHLGTGTDLTPAFQ